MYPKLSHKEMLKIKTVVYVGINDNLWLLINPKIKYVIYICLQNFGPTSVICLVPQLVISSKKFMYNFYVNLIT